MVTTIIISGLTILSIILTSVFKPNIKIKNYSLNLYWIIALLGAILLLLFGLIDIDEVLSKMTSSGSMNPIKILILFISMTVISISLDELGFFSYIARVVLNKCGKNQLSIFLSIYFLVAFLTIFTSNDIVVLTLTPFIINFSKEAKISPIPYLVSEFFSANTWSMFLLIGNPTNIYLTQVYSIEFFEYIKVMAIPTVITGVVELLILLLIFKKDLSKSIEKNKEEVTLKNKTLVIVNLIILVITTILLSISSYIGFEMYLISFIMMVVLLIILFIYGIIKKNKQKELICVVKRAPYELIPFVLSMFVIVLALTNSGITGTLSNLLSKIDTGISYGFSSFISANLFNNIPMSILYASMAEGLEGVSLLKAIYSSVIGSNLGAIFTPLGALAGIMWMNILKKHEVKFRFIDFIKYGLIVSIPLIIVSILSLEVMFI